MGSKKDIPPTTRIEIFNHVLSLTEGNILPRGSLASTARKFDVSKTAVRQIWQKGPENKKKGKTGTKTKWTDQLVSTMVKSVDWENRCTFQALSHDRVLEEDIDSDDEVSLEGNVLATV